MYSILLVILIISVLTLDVHPVGRALQRLGVKITAKIKRKRKI